MVFPAALAGFGINAFQAIQGRKAKKRLQQAGERLIGGQLAEEGQFAASQQQALLKGIEARDKGFSEAKIATANLGRASKRSVLDREGTAQSRISQQLAGSGLLNSSVQANLERGLAGQTNRRLAEIDEGLSGIFSSLAVRRGAARGAGQQSIAQFLGQRQQRRQQIGDTRFDLLNTQLGQQQPIDVGALFSQFGGGRKEEEEEKA